MKASAKGLAWAAAGLALLSAGCGADGRRTAGEETSLWVEAQRRDIRPEAAVVRCGLEARKVVQVSSPLPGAAVLEWVADEGTWVEEGGVVARFDASQWEQDAARQSNDWFRARQERLALENAELPLERLELAAAAADAAEAAADEEAFAETARGLAGRGLMGESEVARQDETAAAARGRAEAAARRLELTERHLHPARLAKAEAAEAAAERLWRQTAAQAAACEVRAPAGGVAGLAVLSFNGEWRPARVGDTLYRNQVFLRIADPHEVVLAGEIGEGELPLVREGWRVEGRSAAFPGTVLQGRVESVGTMGRGKPGAGAWRNVFPVRMAVETAGGGETLPLGVTVDAWVFPPDAEGVLAVPRAALEWRDGAAGVWVEGRGGEEAVWREVERGVADGEWVEVRRGVLDGERVRVRTGAVP